MRQIELPVGGTCEEGGGSDSYRGRVCREAWRWTSILEASGGCRSPKTSRQSFHKSNVLVWTEAATQRTRLERCSNHHTSASWNQNVQQDYSALCLPPTFCWAGRWAHFAEPTTLTWLRASCSSQEVSGNKFQSLQNIFLCAWRSC